MKKITVVLFLLFIFLAKANAANWIEISSDENTTYLIDSSSIKRYPNRIVKLWMKAIFKNPQKIDYSQKEYNSLLSLIKYNCPDDSIMYIQRASYLDLAIVDSATAKNPSYSEIIPDSIGDLIKETVCYKESNKKMLIK